MAAQSSGLLESALRLIAHRLRAFSTFEVSLSVDGKERATLKGRGLGSEAAIAEISKAFASAAHATVVATVKPDDSRGSL